MLEKPDLKKQIIDKMMEVAGHEKRYEDLVKEEPLFEDPYYVRYEMTGAQYNEMLDYVENLAAKNYKLNKKRARREADQFMANYGLRQKIE